MLKHILFCTWAFTLLVPRILIALLRPSSIQISDLPMATNSLFQTIGGNLTILSIYNGIFKRMATMRRSFPLLEINLKFKFCPVRAAFRIIRRAERLKQALHYPLLSKIQDSLILLDPLWINRWFCAVASLKNFTTKSPRVRTYPLFHTMGKLPDIKRKDLGGSLIATTIILGTLTRLILIM